MSEVAEKVMAVRAKELHTYVRGRIEHVRRFEGNGEVVFEHVIRCPKRDDYSMPAVVEVRASRRLGAKGEEWSGLCEVGGFYRRPFKVLDRDTGEEVVVRPVQVTLWAVE